MRRMCVHAAMKSCPRLQRFSNCYTRKHIAKWLFLKNKPPLRKLVRLHVLENRSRVILNHQEIVAQDAKPFRFSFAVLAVFALAFTAARAQQAAPDTAPRKIMSAPTTPSTSTAFPCATASGCSRRSMCPRTPPGGPYPFLMDRTPYSVGPYGEDQYPTHLGPFG